MRNEEFSDNYNNNEIISIIVLIITIISLQFCSDREDNYILLQW